MNKSLRFLAMVIMVMAVNFCFATNYDLWVAGTRVTSSNASNITASGITHGTVSYAASTNTLTLNEATIVAPIMGNAISNSIHGLKIEIIGSNRLSSDLGFAVYSDKELTIKGNGTMDASKQCGTCIQVIAGNLSIMGNCTIIAKSTTAEGVLKGTGILGTSGKSLMITDATVIAEGHEETYGSIGGFSNVSLSGTSITDPMNITYNTSKRRYQGATDNILVTSEIVIEKVNHSLWVAGHKLGTPVEGTYTFTGAGIQGSVVYDFNTNTLTLTDAVVDASTGTNSFQAPIRTQIPDMKIQLVGINAVKNGLLTNIFSNSNMSIYGSGSLDVSITSGSGIRVGGNLVIRDNCLVTAKVKSNSVSFSTIGIIGASGKTLTVNHATVIAEGNDEDYGSIGGFSYVLLQNVSVTSPRGISYNSSNHRYEKDSDGSVVTSEIAIESQNHSLWVAGHKLKGSTSYRFTGSGINGSVVYTFSNNTLTLTNASITANQLLVAGIKNEIPGLKIVLVGDNTVTSTYYSSIYSSADMTIKGSGTFDASRTIGTCIQMDHANLTLSDNCLVIADSHDTGFSAGSGVLGSNDKNLVVNHATLIAKGNGTTHGSIGGFGNVNLIGVSVTTPVEAFYNTTNHCFQNPSYEVVTSEICIESTNHSLWVAGKKLNGTKSYSFTGDGITGSVVYNFADNTLTLTNAAINASIFQDGITNGIPNLKIVLVGSNTITASTIHYSIYSYGNLTITGTGSLDVSKENGTCIYVQNGDLYIRDNCTVTSKSQGYDGLTGTGVLGSEGKTLHVINANLYARGSDNTYGSIGGFGHVQIEGATMTSPTNISYNLADRCYRNNTYGYVVTETINIEASQYNLWIRETQVTSSNCSDILGDGTVSFDYTTNILTLNNAEINDVFAHGITNEIYGLKINLVGDNVIACSKTSGIFAEEDAPITFQGQGTLTVSGVSGIMVHSNLSFTDGCTVHVIGTGMGENSAIASMPSDNTTITFSDCTVEACSENTTRGIIYGFSNVNMLSNSSIVYPSGAQWNPLTYRIEDESNEILTGTVIIDYVTYPLYVHGIQVSSYNQTDVLQDGGSVSYNPNTSTLTLNNANINLPTNRDGIKSESDLNINLVGENFISGGRYGIYPKGGDCTIQGNGSLTVETYRGLYAYGEESQDHTVTFTGGCRVTFNCTYYGIYYFNGTIAVDGAEVRAQGMTSSWTCNALVLTSTSILSPAGAVLENRHIRVDGTTVTNEYVVVGPQPYDLTVLGIPVSAANRYDILGDGGSVCYDPGENVLTLNNAYLNSTSSGVRGIENEIEDLIINLIGENTIDVESSGIYSNKDLVIEGLGTLIVSGDDGIYASSCNLTIQGGCTVTTTGKSNNSSYCGIYGTAGYNLTVINSLVTAQKNPQCNYPIFGFEPQLVGCHLENEGIEWSSSYYTDTNGNAVTSPIIIAPDLYNLRVGDVWVSTANASHIESSCVSGSVSYDAEHKVLTLHNASIKDSGSYWGNGISNYMDDLTIRLIGNSSIDVSGSGIYSEYDMVIEGPGKIEVRGSDGIRAYECDLTIQGGCTIVAYGMSGGDYAGIYGEPTYRLTINRSRVEATAESNIKSAICGFDILEFTDNKVGFQYPSNAFYSGGYVMYDEYTIYTNDPIIIDGDPYGISVAGLEVTSANCDNITRGVLSGQVSYDPTTCTLTLDNAQMTSPSMYIDVIRNMSVPTLTIALVGDNYIDACYNEGRNAINITGSDCNIIIKGVLGDDGYGTLTSNGTIYTYANNNHLTITDGCTVTLSSDGTYNSGCVNGNGSLALSVVNATLYANQVTEITDFTGNIIEPSDASYVRFNNWIGYYGEPATDIVIGDEYYLWVAGTQVTTLNAANITSDAITGGSVSYDPANNMLVLDNVTICDAVNMGIQNLMSPAYGELTVKLNGNNTFQMDDNMAIFSQNTSVSFIGDGKLTVVAADGFSIKGNMTMTDNCSIDITTSNDNSYAIEGFGGQLEIGPQNTLRALANSLSERSPITGFNDLILNGVDFIQPVDAHYSTTHKRVEDANGDPVKALVEIGYAAYDLWVNEVQITTANANNLILDELEEGTISYDHTTNTLTLSDVTLDVSQSGKAGIRSQIDGLTIQLEGVNEINQSNYGIQIEGVNTTIAGTGYLYLTPHDHVAIYASGMTDKSLVLTGGCSVVVTTTDAKGIYMDYGTLVVEEAYLDINERFAAPIDVEQLELPYTSIVLPVDGYFDEESRRIRNSDDSPCISRVIIQTELYPLYVAGVQVSAANCYDVLGDGTVYYDYDFNSLYLNNTTINAVNENGITSQIDNLNVVLYGSVNINSTEIGIELYRDATISGSGSLTISAQAGITANNQLTGDVQPSLTLEGGCVVTVVNSFQALNLGSQGEGGVLTVKGSTFDGYSVYGGIPTIVCRDLNLVDAMISIPYGAEFSPTFSTILYNSYQVEDHVVISPEAYDLWIADTQVTAANAGDFYGDGTVRYNHAQHTLTLDGATIVSEEISGSGIKTKIEDLHVVLEGTNTLTAVEDGLSLYEDVTISGPGTLNIASRYGVYTYGFNPSSMTLDGGCTVNMDNDVTAINLGNGAGAGTLTVNCATLDAVNTKGDDPFVTIKCGDLQLIGSSITLPENGLLSNYQIMTQDFEYPEHVVISIQTYPLYVEDVQVTALNAADVIGDNMVVYEPSTNTLTLNLAALYTDVNGIVYEGTDDLTLNLIGENHIYANNTGIYIGDAKLIVTGTGSLFIDSRYGVMGEFSATEWAVQDGCYVEINSTDWGVYMPYGTLTVANAELRVTGAEYGSVRCNALNMTNVTITYPEDAAWNDDYHCVADLNGSMITTQVIFSPDAYELYVAGVQVTCVNASNVLGDGKVVYDAANHTLTLNSAIIEHPTYGIQNGGIDDLNLVLNGNTYISSYIGIQYNVDDTPLSMTISGTGSLYIDASYVGINNFQSGSALNIEGGCSVEINAVVMGVCLLGNTLTVDNSQLISTGSGNGAVRCATLNLVSARVISPMGAEWNSDYGTFIDQDGLTIESVTIAPANIFCATVDNNWNLAGNWSQGAIPSSSDNVYINADCIVDEDVTVEQIMVESEGTLTIPNGSYLKVQTLINTDRTKLIVEDGGQLFHYNGGVGGTIKRNIAGYGTSDWGYCLISEPFVSDISVEYDENLGGTNLVSTDFEQYDFYDLYAYDEPTAYWINQKQNTELGESQIMYMSLGKGYIYASKDDKTISVSSDFGEGFYCANASYAVQLSNESTIIPGFNLVGNPFPCNAKVFFWDGDGEMISPAYYKMNADGDGLDLVAAGTALTPMEGIFVVYEEGYTYAIFVADEGSVMSAYKVVDWHREKPLPEHIALPGRGH